MRPWIAAAHRTGGRRNAARASQTVGTAADIRAWAKDNGHPMPLRGRIPRTIVAAYKDAHR